MKNIVIGILTVAIPAVLILLAQQNQTISDPVAQQWSGWKSEHGIHFVGETDLYRRLVFMRNFDLIERHNSQESKSFEMSMNQFSHLSTQEFDEMFSSKKERNIQEAVVGK